MISKASTAHEEILSQAVPFYSKIISFKAVKIAVAPVVAAAAVPVEGHPHILGAASAGYGNHGTPSAESAVGIVEFCGLHSVLSVDAVFGAFVEIVSANEVKLAALADEYSARFGCSLGTASDVSEALEGIV